MLTQLYLVFFSYCFKLKNNNSFNFCFLLLFLLLEDDDIEVEDSIEAIFAKTNNNNLQAEITSEKSEPTTSKLLKSPKKSNKKINETKKIKETKKDTEHNKENDETVTKKPRAKRTTTKTINEKVGDVDKESEEKTVTKPKKQQTRSKKIAVEDNEDAVIDDKDSESDEETKAKTKKQPKTPKAKKVAKVDESESEHEIVSETEVIQPVFPLDSNGKTLLKRNDTLKIGHLKNENNILIKTFKVKVTQP